MYVGLLFLLFIYFSRHFTQNHFLFKFEDFTRFFFLFTPLSLARAGFKSFFFQPFQFSFDRLNLLSNLFRTILHHWAPPSILILFYYFWFAFGEQFFSFFILSFSSLHFTNFSFSLLCVYEGKSWIFLSFTHSRYKIYLSFLFTVILN